jgi:CHAD domain-containing protein
MKLSSPDAGTIAFGAGCMARQLAAIQVEIPGVQAGADLECIHRMRVASRRLRAAQAYFDDILPSSSVKKWEDIILNITSALGQARDLDIQMQTLRRFQILREKPDFLPGVEGLLSHMTARRGSAQLGVQLGVQRLIDSKLIKRVSDFLQACHLEGAVTSTTPLRLLADQAISIRLKHFLSYEQFIHDPNNKTELHAMRIAAKRLRYTLELFAPLDGDEFKVWLKVIKQNQELLGAIHDCDVWIDFLPKYLVEFMPDNSTSLDGIILFLTNRMNNRKRLYQEFINGWERDKTANIWQRLIKRLAKTYPAVCTGVELIPNKKHVMELTHENSPYQ